MWFFFFFFFCSSADKEFSHITLIYKKVGHLCMCVIQRQKCKCECFFFLLDSNQSVFWLADRETCGWICDESYRNSTLPRSTLRFPLCFIKSTVRLIHCESGVLPQKSSYFPFQTCGGYMNYYRAYELSESASPNFSHKRLLLLTFNKQKHISVGCSFMTLSSFTVSHVGVGLLALWAR